MPSISMINLASSPLSSPCASAPPQPPATRVIEAPVDSDLERASTGPSATPKRSSYKRLGMYGMLATTLVAAAGVSGYFGYQAQTSKMKKPSTTPTTTPTPTTTTTTTTTPRSANDTGISMVAAYNKAFGTYYNDSQTGFAALQHANLGDFKTPALFAAYACSDAQANTSCTLSQALQGNGQQVNLPLVIVDEDFSQLTSSVSVRCDTGTHTQAQIFTAPLPQPPATNASRGFFSRLISPDAECLSDAGTPQYNFHYNLTAGNQLVGDNNSVVLFKFNAAGQVTNALVGVNQGERGDPMFFNEPIYNLQMNY